MSSEASGSQAGRAALAWTLTRTKHGHENARRIGDLSLLDWFMMRPDAAGCFQSRPLSLRTPASTARPENRGEKSAEICWEEHPLILRKGAQASPVSKRARQKRFALEIVNEAPSQRKCLGKGQKRCLITRLSLDSWESQTDVSCPERKYLTHRTKHSGQL